MGFTILARRAAVALLASCALALALTGCHVDLNDETSARTSQRLQPAITITLTAPPSLSPLAPVLLGSNLISLGVNSNIVSGTIASMGAGGVITQPDALLNDTWSAGPAVLADRTNVRGTLHAAAVTLGNGTMISGRDATPALSPPSTLSWTVQYPAGTGPSQTVQAGQSVTLSPGLYGSYTFNSASQVTLRAGTYYFSDFVVNSQVTVSLNQAAGPVIVYVNSNLILRGAFAASGSSDAGPIHPDLLIGYLGTNPVYVESLFDGAIVAPRTSLTLRQVQGIHTGFFAAQSVNEIDSNTRVQYRAPLAILPASGASGSTCGALLSGLVPGSAVATDSLTYCTTCASPDDTDRDLVPDCVDRCPYDPNKIAPGICGCGHSDVDTDHDGVPDCLDQCPQDPNNVTVGECGCVGDLSLKPAGTACTDTACPQSGATCNGAGVCGNRAACSPGAGCTFIDWRSTGYWICGEPSAATGKDLDAGAPDGGDGGNTTIGLATQAAAQAACSAKGLTLTRIDTLSQNRFIDQLLGAPVWLGANDRTASGVWRWSAPGTINGDQFWTGGATGSPISGRFANWAPGAPASQQCAALQPSSGLWVDVNCAQSTAYICEYQVPWGVGADGGPLAPIDPPGMPDQPAQAADAAPCMPEDAAYLPNTIAELQREIEAGRNGQFIGAAANRPPDGSVCVDSLDAGSQAIGLQPDAGIGCAFVNIQNNLADCIHDSDCPAGFVCRETKDTPSCRPPDGGVGAPTTFIDGSTCRGHSVCGQLVCPQANGPCDLVTVCTSGTSYDAGLDDASTLTPRPFDPASLFGGEIPDADPSDGYSDPPDGNGPNHTWCQMVPQDPNSVKEATPPSGQLHGQSGGGSIISFGFDPDLVFDVNANPLALGETNLHLIAKGSLNATASLSGFLGQSFTGSILKASIGIEANRCTLDDVTPTTFQVFGLDLIDPFSFGIPKINTNDPTIDANVAKFSSQCNDAVGTFLLWADRAKKAFRDAQQLLQQYHALQQTGQTLQANLCDALGIAAATVPSFPGGNACQPGETPEITINRFIDYYQGPGSGQISQLRNAMGSLSSITSKLTDAMHLPSINKTFSLINQEESQTILEVPFAIGPVPMLLEVDVFADYGVDGNLDAELKFPLSLDANDIDVIKPVAKAGASVVPHASAGLSAFVGAGFDFGALSAEIGIEGAVTLAEIRLPVNAGADLDMTVTQDFRPIPADVGPPIALASTLTHFGIPTAFKFFVGYDYGIHANLDKILAGEIDAKLHIEFFFFSRTWRKQIVHFNGFHADFDIISGSSSPGTTYTPYHAGQPNAPTSGSGNGVGGSAPMGRSEQQVPLMVLSYLPLTTPSTARVSDGGVSDAGVSDGSVPFDASAVQGMFYDNLCCLKPNAQCFPNSAPTCCPGSSCQGPDSGQLIIFTCVPDPCGSVGAHCKQNGDCCSGNCGSEGLCLNACGNAGAQCATNADCCDGFSCTSGTCQHLCLALGESCTSTTECCAGTCNFSGQGALGTCGSIIPR